jgi:hypothetical protein
LIHGFVDQPAVPECSEVTTDEARALVDILGDRSVEDLEGDRIIREITMMLVSRPERCERTLKGGVTR